VLEPVDALVRGTWNVDYTTTQIQLNANTQMALNVDGSTPFGPGSSVLAWQSGQGATNEAWTFTAVGQPVDVRVAVAAGLE
jgi:hypothetical protein